MGFEVRPMREEDRDEVVRIAGQAFNVPASHRQRTRHIPLEQVRVAAEGSRLLGTVRIFDMGHWWGGRSVPAAGIAMVAVSPEARGRKVAEAMMTETLRELRAAGTPLSTLYPATVSLYRRVGYEYAAARTEWKIDLRSLPKGSDLDCDMWDDADVDEIAACRAAWAAESDGHVDRPRWWWTEKTFDRGWDDAEVYRLCVREGGAITGYMIYTQPKPKGSDWGYEIACRDFVWRTPAAARALTTVAARHRSLGHRLIFYGPPVEPLAFITNEQDISLTDRFDMMGRLVDLPAAIEARGYPPHVEAAVEIRVRDELLPDNDASWSIAVSDGRAKVAAGDGARASTDVATFSALWAGMLRARDAVRTGRLSATDGDVEALDAIFGGRTPWIADFF